MFGQRAASLRRKSRIASDGCYFMCGVMLAWETGDPSRTIRPADVLRWYDELHAAGVLRRAANDARDGCYVMDPGRMVGLMGGEALFRGKYPPDYDLADDERAIELWTLLRPQTGGIWRHFVYGTYDPWVSSITRRDGMLDSLRVFKVV